MSEPNRMDRRQFAGEFIAGTSLITAGIAGAMAPSLYADDKPAASKEGDEKKSAKEETPAEKPDVPPEVMLLSYLVRQYPSEHFDKEAISGIYRDIRGDVARGRVLHDFPLTNSDEPAFVFRA